MVHGGNNWGAMPNMTMIGAMLVALAAGQPQHTPFIVGSAPTTGGMRSQSLAMTSKKPNNQAPNKSTGAKQRFVATPNKTAITKKLCVTKPQIMKKIRVPKAQALQAYQEETVATTDLPLKNTFTPLRIVKKNSPTACIRTIWELPTHVRKVTLPLVGLRIGKRRQTTGICSGMPSHTVRTPGCLPKDPCPIVIGLSCTMVFPTNTEIFSRIT